MLLLTMTDEARASNIGFPSGVLIVTHKSSQTDKTRHFGRDAEIQAMDGNQPVVQVFYATNLPSCFS